MRFVTALLPLALLAAAPAKATIVVETWEFSATVNTGPIRNHAGSFSFSYDSTAAFSPTLLSIDFAIGTTVFDTTNTAIAPFFDGWAIGGTLGGNPNPIQLSNGVVDWYLTRSTPQTSFFYAEPGMLSAGSTFAPTITNIPNEPQTPVSGAVPEPGTWAMLVLGFGFIGGAMRSAGRRQRTWSAA